MKNITMHYKKHYERLIAELRTPQHVLAEEVLRLSLENHAIGNVSGMRDEEVCCHLGEAAKRLARGNGAFRAELELWLFALHGEWCARGKPLPRRTEEKPPCPWGGRYPA